MAAGARKKKQWAQGGSSSSNRRISNGQPRLLTEATIEKQLTDANTGPKIKESDRLAARAKNHFRHEVFANANWSRKRKYFVHNIMINK
jgi:hypothetical protein